MTLPPPRTRSHAISRNAGIGDKVEQVVEPAMRIISGPTVQLGLDLQYPAAPPKVADSSSSVFTSVLPAFQHLRCGLAGPLRHVRASRALGLLRGLRPTRRPSAGNEPAHRRTGCPAGGRPRTVPTFTTMIDRPGRRPAIPRQHRHAYAADFQRGLPAVCCTPASELTPAHSGGHALHPGPYPPGLSRALDYGASATGSLALRTSGLASRTRTVWQYQPVPTLSGLLPALPGVPRIRLPPASTGRCDDPKGKVFHLHSTYVRSIRGALPVLPSVGFPGSPPAPGVHLSAHRALRKPRRAGVYLMLCSAMVSRSSFPGSSSASR